MRFRSVRLAGVLLALAMAGSLLAAQSKKPRPAGAPATPQKLDEEYTQLIKEYLQDPRITTELVDHMPASDTVPSPLKFLGRIPGKPGELTYAEGHLPLLRGPRQVSPRARFWKIGQTEEGRDQVILAIADEATISDLDSYKGLLAQARRSAQTHRGAGRRHRPYRQAHLLGRQRHPLARNRRPRNAHRAGLPPHRRGNALHPDHPQQRHHLHHARRRSRRPRKTGRHLLLRQAAPAGRPAPAAHVLGQVRAARQQPRRHGPVSEDHPELHPRRCSSGTPPSCTTCTKRNLISTSPPAPAPTTSRSTPSRSTSGGCSPKPKSWRWPSAACPASGPTAITTAGCRTTCSGSASRTIPSAASTKCRATART